MTVQIPRCVVTCRVHFAVLIPIFQIRDKDSGVKVKWRSPVIVVAIQLSQQSRAVPVGASGTVMTEV